MNEMEIASLKLDCLRLAGGSESEAEKKFAFVSGSKPNANAPIHAAEGNAEQAAYRTYMDTQLLKAETINSPAAITPKTGNHASDVLYPAIEAAMKELQSLHPGFNRAVNRAFNHLHGAFWSECPAPASAATLRPENFQAPGPSMDGTATADSLIRASDSAIEREIQAKGKIAPRVTPADLQANIVHTEIVKHVSHSGQVLRWAVLTTRSGFAVTGNPSASVSPKNDIPEIGEKTAIENATQSLWPLMGYALKEKLAAEQTGAAKKRINICGVDCHRGDDECNGYCIGKAPHAKLIEA